MKLNVSIPGPASSPALITALAILLLLMPSRSARADNTLLFEGFESGGFPAGWTRIKVPGNLDWQVTGTRANVSNYSAVASFGPLEVVQDIWLISPPIDPALSPNVGLRLYESGDFWQDFGGIHEILISNTSPDIGEFTLVKRMTPGDHSLGTPWQPLEVDLSPFLDILDGFYIAFRYLGEYADDWYIDDVNVYVPSGLDVLAGEFFMPPDAFIRNAPLDFDFWVVNQGAQDTGPFDVDFTVTDLSGTDVLNFSESVINIPSGETSVISADVTIPESGYYTINATTLLPGDEDPGNDSASAPLEFMPKKLRPLNVLDIVYDETESNAARFVLDPNILATEDVFSNLVIHKTVAPSPFYNGQMDPVRLRFFDFPMAGGPNLDQNNRREWNTPSEPPILDWGSVPGELMDGTAVAASPSVVSTDIVIDPLTGVARVQSIIHNHHELKPGSENRIFFYDTRDNAEGGGYHATHLNTLNTSQGQLVENSPGVQIFEFEYHRDPAIPIQDLKIVTEVSRFEEGTWDRVVQSDAQRLVPKGGAPLMDVDFTHARRIPAGWTTEPPGPLSSWRIARSGEDWWGGSALARLGTSAEVDAAITAGLEYLEETLLRGSFRLMVDDPPTPGTQFEVLVSTGGTSFPADFSSLMTVDLTAGPPPGVWEKLEFLFPPPTGTTQLRFAFAVSGPEPPGDSFLHLDDILIEPDEAANIRMTHTRDVGVRAMVFPELPILTTGPPPMVFLEVGNFVTLPGDPADFEARFIIRDQVGDVVHNEVRPVAGLAAGDFRVLPFDVPALAPGRFDFIGDVMLTGDQDGFNDLIIIEEVEAYEHPLVNFSLGVVNEGDTESDILRAAVDGETSIWSSRFSHVQAHANDLFPDRFFDEDPAMHMLLRDMPHYADAAGLPSFSGEFLFPQEEYLGQKSVPWSTIVQNWLAAAGTHASPMTLDSSFFWFVPQTSGQIWVDITLDHQLRADRDYYLYATITEDNADGLGYNHVPRVLYPDVNGRLIDKYPGFFQKIFSFSLDPSWKFDDLRLVSWVVEKSPDGFEKIVQSDSRFVTDTPSAVREVPARTALTGVHPNPFNPRTTVSFEIASRGRARVAVYDLSGRLVEVLANREFPAGNHDLVWSGRDRNDQTVAAGVYLVRMEAGSVVETARMTLVK